MGDQPRHTTSPTAAELEGDWEDYLAALAASNGEMLDPPPPPPLRRAAPPAATGTTGARNLAILQDMRDDPNADGWDSTAGVAAITWAVEQILRLRTAVQAAQPDGTWAPDS